MRTLLNIAHAVIVRRAVRSITAVAFALVGELAVAPAHAQPVEYVKVCSVYGAGFFYIPGTDTCVNARQIVDNQVAIAHAATTAATGVAMAASLANPYLPNGTNFAVSSHWAGFDGQNAAGFSGLMRLSGNFVFSAGFAAGLDRGRVTSLSNRNQTQFGTTFPVQTWSDVRTLGRAGFMYAW